MRSSSAETRDGERVRAARSRVRENPMATSEGKERGDRFRGVSGTGGIKQIIVGAVFASGQPWFVASAPKGPPKRAPGRQIRALQKLPRQDLHLPMRARPARRAARRARSSGG